MASWPPARQVTRAPSWASMSAQHEAVDLVVVDGQHAEAGQALLEGRRGGGRGRVRRARASPKCRLRKGRSMIGRCSSGNSARSISSSRPAMARLRRSAWRRASQLRQAWASAAKRASTTTRSAAGTGPKGVSRVATAMPRSTRSARSAAHSSGRENRPAPGCRWRGRAHRPARPAAGSRKKWCRPRDGSRPRCGRPSRAPDGR